jgi:hypothetical protein
VPLSGMLPIQTSVPIEGQLPVNSALAMTGPVMGKGTIEGTCPPTYMQQQQPMAAPRSSYSTTGSTTRFS